MADPHLARELKWLKEHPEFNERPPSLREFLGPNYLNIASGVRLAIQDVLAEIIGEDVNDFKPTKFERAIITGGIGIGKTTIASIVLPYLVCWCLCLKNPQEFFGLLPGSRIAFMQMSTSEQQAKEVVFGDIAARIQHSAWFKKHPHDPKITSQFRWPEKDIWIIPGDSAETTFEGYNILGGILDEADSHKVTKDKDYGRQGYNTIYNRMSSRFEDRGFVLVIGQMKKATGFAAQIFKEFTDDPDAFATRMAIWESRGDAYFVCKTTGPHEENQELKPGHTCGQVHKFAYDTARKDFVPIGIARKADNRNLIFVPVVYHRQFRLNPEKALKDLAGIPPIVGDPFFQMTYRIHDARDRWIERHGTVSPVDHKGQFRSDFRARENIKRVLHIDMGYASGGDACGIAMGHVSHMIQTDNGERKPFIDIDMIMRLTPPAGRELMFSDVRQIVYDLRDKLKFNITTVTMDGFESTDTMQQFKKRRFKAEYVSMDREILPYEDVKDAIYEERFAMPPLMVRFRPEDTELTEIAVKELSELVDTGTKIDHPDGGTKDVADAIAGVTFTLMGSRRYHSSVVDIGDYKSAREVTRPGVAVGGDFYTHRAYTGHDSGMHAPVPPTANWSERR